MIVTVNKDDNNVKHKIINCTQRNQFLQYTLYSEKYTSDLENDFNKL